MAIASDHRNYRVAGVCVHEDHVLLHREEKDDFWVMPGGRPRVYESSRDALGALPNSLVHVIHVDQPD